jgi:hypothetical protein
VNVRLSTELAIVLLVVNAAILLSAAFVLRQDPWLLPLGIAGVVLYRRRRRTIR